MDVKWFEIAGPAEIKPIVHKDPRGYFCETFNAADMAKAGIPNTVWVQDNQSFSAATHTLRGLHFQIAPFAQAKLVRVLKGRILDVAVDLRRSSMSFGKWIATNLSAMEFNQLYVPTGFAHGYLTLEPDVEILYKVSAPYSKAHERVIRWDDADMDISWLVAKGIHPVLSDRDATAPGFAQVVEQLQADAER
jgi:dTDP-4-dehydrorhamnose 3,5-epimerase